MSLLALVLAAPLPAVHIITAAAVSLAVSAGDAVASASASASAPASAFASAVAAISAPFHRITAALFMVPIAIV